MKLIIAFHLGRHCDDDINGGLILIMRWYYREVGRVKTTKGVTKHGNAHNEVKHCGKLISISLPFLY